VKDPTVDDDMSLEIKEQTHRSVADESSDRCVAIVVAGLIGNILAAGTRLLPYSRALLLSAVHRVIEWRAFRRVMLIVIVVVRY